MVAQSSANFTIFRGNARQPGTNFGTQAQTLERTVTPFIKKYIVLAAKRIGADSYEIAAQELGELVSGRKNSKTLQKMLEQKQFENSWEVEKKSKRRASTTIFRKKIG